MSRIDPASRTGPRATLADLLALEERGERYELIDGELIEKDAGPATGKEAGTFEHGEAQLVACHFLYPYRRRAGGEGPGGWSFSVEPLVRFGEDVLRPDVAGWRRERLPERPKDDPVVVIPDWTCEILSTNRRNDLVRKKHLCHRHHVGHYWIVDPLDQTLSVYRWHADGYLEVLAAERGQRVRAEPFDAIELPVGAF